MGNIFSFFSSRFSIMLYTIPVLLIAFPVHELSHGLTAYALGDKTAKNEGRLTLNPFKHMDLIGTICIIVIGFGWAKPVPVNPNNFKNPKGGMAITALSGPLSNLILAFISVILCEFTNNALMNMYGTMYTIFGVVLQFFRVSAIINISLCLFNLIPIPPLDGEKILAIFLPDSAEAFFERNAMFFQVAIMFLLFTPIITDPLNYMVQNVYTNFVNIANLIFHVA